MHSALLNVSWTSSTRWFAGRQVHQFLSVFHVQLWMRLQENRGAVDAAAVAAVGAVGGFAAWALGQM